MVILRCDAGHDGAVVSFVLARHHASRFSFRSAGHFGDREAARLQLVFVERKDLLKLIGSREGEGSSLFVGIGCRIGVLGRRPRIGGYPIGGFVRVGAHLHGAFGALHFHSARRSLIGGGHGGGAQIFSILDSTPIHINVGQHDPEFPKSVTVRLSDSFVQPAIDWRGRAYCGGVEPGFLYLGDGNVFTRDIAIDPALA